MTEFKQIVGRGTRVREDCNKLYFTIMDSKNYVKFADPEFDGDPVQIKDVGEYDDFDDDDTNTDDGTGIDTGNTDDDYGDDGSGYDDDGGNDGTGDDGDAGHKKRKRYTVNGINVRIVDEKVEYSMQTVTNYGIHY